MSSGVAFRGWDDDVIASLLTAERLSSYHVAAGGDRRTMLALYEWNIEAASSVVALAATVEVISRTALDRQLCSWASGRHGSATWFDHVPLDQRGRKVLAEARQRAMRGNGAEVHGKVIAELPFGFWRYLVGSRYHTRLWIPGLASAFPEDPEDLRARRMGVEHRLQQLAFVRNRAAHHEPIHRRNLRNDLLLAIELINWVSPDAARWASGLESLSDVYRRRP